MKAHNIVGFMYKLNLSNILVNDYKLLKYLGILTNCGH